MFLEKMGHGINTWVIKNTFFLEISFTDYVLASYVFWWPYALSSLFLAPIKRLNCRNKLVNPCRDCPSVVLSGSPFPSPREISPTARLLFPWDFPKKEHWSGLPFPSPGDLSDPGLKLVSPVLQADSLQVSYWEAHLMG